MKHTAIATLALVSLAAFANPASAAGTWSEADTRAANGIPSAVVYTKGTAGVYSPGVRCFQAKATRRTHVQGELVRKGHTVGYCTDGYVDVLRNSGQFPVVIHPGR